MKALSDGDRSLSMCCSTGDVLCNFQRVIISGIFRLAPITDYYIYRNAAYDKTLMEIRPAAYRPKIMVTHIFILESHIWV
jgi:hypothetical protein